MLVASWAAVESWRFVEGLIPAINKLMKKLDTSVDSFDLFENDEAFSLNNVLLRRALETPYEKINVHGGAITLGHPIGASGARIIVTLLHALQSKGRHAAWPHYVTAQVGNPVAVELV